MAEKRQQRLGQERLVQFNCPEKKKKRRCVVNLPEKIIWHENFSGKKLIQQFCSYDAFFFAEPLHKSARGRSQSHPEGEGIQEKKQQLSLAAKDERTQWTRRTEELP